MLSLGKKLKSLRKLKKVTQRQTANAIDVTERNYQAYEADTQKPSYDSLLALSNFFKVPVDYLVGAGLYGQLEEYPTLRKILCERLRENYGKLLDQFHLPPLEEMDIITFVEITSAFLEEVIPYSDQAGTVFAIHLKRFPEPNSSSASEPEQ